MKRHRPLEKPHEDIACPCPLHRLCRSPRCCRGCSEKPAAEPLRSVRTAEIRYDKAKETNRYVGTVQSRHEVNEAFRVGGKVLQRKVDVGQKVREGDVLAVLDDADYRHAEEAARQQFVAATTQARQAESDRKRLDALKSDGSVSVSDEEKAQSSAETATATAEAAGAAARTRAQPAEVHGAACVAKRCGHRSALRGRTGRRRRPAGRFDRERGRARDRRRCAGGSPGRIQGVALQGMARKRARADVRGRAARAFAAGGSANANLPRPPEAGACRGRCRSARPPRSSSSARSAKRRRRRSPPRRSRRTRASPRSGSFAAPGPNRLGTVDLLGVTVHGYRNDEVLVSGPPAGELVVTAGVQKMAPGLKVALPACRAQRRNEAGRPMKSFNLTEWALGHRAIVLFLILVIGIGGVLGFTKLGQLEDPNFSVPSMTAIVYWPGATAQQVQDELLNRMEKKFEQLDHFEKVKTYARQGYGAHDDHRGGRHLESGSARSVVPGAQEVQRHQTRASRRRHRPDLQRRIRRCHRAALRRQGRRHQSVGTFRHCGGRQAPPAQGADGQEGRHLRQASQEGLRRVLAPAAGRARHHADHDCRKPQEPERRPCHRSDRHARRPRAGAGQRAVQQPGRYPQRADRRWRPAHQARRLHDDHARLRRPADVHRAPQRPAGADDRHHDDRRRQHRRSRQVD